MGSTRGKGTGGPKPPSTSIVRRPGVDLDAAARQGAEVPTPDAARDAAGAAFEQAATPDSTKAAYVHDWLMFLSWCTAAGARALPASSETICAFLTDRVTKDWPRGKRKPGPDAPATVERRLAVIASKHVGEGFPSPWKDPMVQRTLVGIRKTKKQRQNQAKPLLAANLLKVMESFTGRWALRNRAALHLGWAGCMREGEIAGIDAEHLSYDAEGNLVVYFAPGTTKTDDTAQGASIVVSRGEPGRCPVEDVQAHLQAARITAGPVFRKSSGKRLSRHSIDAIVQRGAKAAGLVDWAEYSGHSLRAGFATQAALSGVPEWRIQQQGRWESAEMVRRYTRPVNQAREQVTKKLWEKNDV
ncbi:MAG: tyrosine-type recombinase/integrase [Acidobacteriota bacterium]|nr:tyrosine-type recombinase/integrase [Acidobacteriota bacterium]